MNIFRDLVEELKDENLLEETVIDPVSEGEGSADQVDGENEPPVSESSQDESVSADAESVPEAPQPVESGEDSESEVLEMENSVPVENPAPAAGSDVLDVHEAAKPTAAEESQPGSMEAQASNEPDDAPPMPKAAEAPKQEVRRSPEEERQFYRQRAMDFLIRRDAMKFTWHERCNN